MAFATTERAPDATPRLYWLHVPKCGTTFSNLFVRAACPHVVSDDEFRTPVRPATLKNAKDCAFAFGGFRIGHPPVTERHWTQVNGGMVTILRRPASRVASGFFDGLHDCKPLRSRFGLPDDPTVGIWRHFFRSFNTSVALDYARCVTACSVNMLTGRPCGAGAASAEQRAAALQHLRNDFAFVGVHEKWGESLDRFASLARVEVTSLDRQKWAWHNSSMFSARRAEVEQLYSTLSFDDDELYAAATEIFAAGGEGTRQVMAAVASGRVRTKK